MNFLTSALMIMLFVVFAVGVLWWRHARSNDLLERWAERNGYQIIRRQYRFLFRGPFFLTTARGQAVYYVTVEDREGTVRNGWVRCGSWWFGLLSDQAQVQWEN
jgi:hypothetical protein